MDKLSADTWFNVGDIVIIVGADYPEFLNMEGEVLALPRPHDWLEHNGYWVQGGEYLLRLRNGQQVSAEGRDLRKKRPPREDLKIVRWSECPWQPQQVSA